MSRTLLLAAGSGFAATLALGLSPWWEGLPPVPVPGVGLDLKPFLLPALFTGLHALLGHARWPFPATVLPALALGVAGVANLQGSALLGFLADFPGAAAGDRVDVVRALASGAALLLALAAGMDRARSRLGRMLRDAGVEDARADLALRAADAHAVRILGFTGAAFVALTLVAALGDDLFGSARAPVPELLGAAVAVGVAALLFPGVAERLRSRRPSS